MRLLPLLSLLVVISSACNDSAAPSHARDLELQTIDSLENILFVGDGSLSDRNAALVLVKSYAKYYQANQPDTLAIDMLFKAGEVSMGLTNGDLAVKYFATVAETHPTFNKAPEALFLAAFCEETLKGDAQQAKFFYEEFLKKYPSHKLAEDAKFSIQNLGKSDEDLIKMFEKGQQSQK